jgi:hypothetical protein
MHKSKNGARETDKELYSFSPFGRRHQKGEKKVGKQSLIMSACRTTCFTNIMTVLRAVSRRIPKVGEKVLISDRRHLDLNK